MLCESREDFFVSREEREAFRTTDDIGLRRLFLDRGVRRLSFLEETLSTDELNELAAGVWETLIFVTYLQNEAIAL